jgi:Arabinose efflux permease
MIIVLMLVFVAGNLLAAVAPSYAPLMAGRVLAALCHGAFFGVASVVAADLVDVSKRSRAIAMVFTGLTVANVAGSPLGTLIGQAFGWRATFVMITILGLVSLLGIVLLVPAQPRPEGASLRREFREFRRLQDVGVPPSVAGVRRDRRQRRRRGNRGTLGAGRYRRSAFRGGHAAKPAAPADPRTARARQGGCAVTNRLAGAGQRGE